MVNQLISRGEPYIIRYVKPFGDQPTVVHFARVS